MAFRRPSSPGVVSRMLSGLRSCAPRRARGVELKVRALGQAACLRGQRPPACATNPDAMAATTAPPACAACTNIPTNATAH
eukprot:358472-Chlamydomonas_euryale.AAC.6